MAASQHIQLCRFLYIIQYFVGNGFYVVLDNQIGQYTEDQTIMSNPALLAQNWVNLFTVSISELLCGVLCLYVCRSSQQRLSCTCLPCHLPTRHPTPTHCG